MTNNAKRLLSMLMVVMMVISMLPTNVLAAGIETGTKSGVASTSEEPRICPHCNTPFDQIAEESWLAWNGTDNITESGHYRLTESVSGDTEPNNIGTAETPVNVLIDLTGKSLIMNSAKRCFAILAGSELTVFGEGGKIHGGGNGGGVVSMAKGATFNMYDVEMKQLRTSVSSSVSAAEGTVISMVAGDANVRTTVNMYSGTIVGGALYTGASNSVSDGLVFVSAYSTFNMHDGIIYSGHGTGAIGGCVYMTASTSAFNMYGGTMDAIGTTVKQGGLVYAGNGTVNIEGGTLYGGSATNGGIIYAAAGTVNVKGGTIHGGTVTENGGAIYISGNSTKLVVSGKAVINGGTAANGGAIYSNNSPITISGGKISGGHATENGGAIYFYSSAGARPMNISGGTIENGSADGNGGNIYVERGTVQISDATISGGSATIGGNICAAEFNDGTNIRGGYIGLNSDVTIENGTATAKGGNIAVLTTSDAANAAALTMAAGTVAGGSAPVGAGIYAEGTAKVDISGGTVSGGEVYISADADPARILISGAPVIEKLNLTDNQVTISKALDDGASIGIIAEEGQPTLLFGTGVTGSSVVQYIHAANAGGKVDLDENGQIVMLHVHQFDENGLCADCNQSFVAQVGDEYYNDLTAAIEAGIAAGKTVILLANVTLSAVDATYGNANSKTIFELSGKNTLKLDLNGRKISCDEDLRLFRLLDGFTLELTSSADKKGIIEMAGLQSLDSVSGQGGGFIQLNSSGSSVLNAENIIFTKTRQDTSCTNTTEAGDVKAVPGGILQVRGAGTATLTNCDFIWAEGITGNVNGGGCISVANQGAKVTMTGCTLSGGRALNGGNLGLAGSCTAIVEDCVIENGVATSINDLDGGNIYMNAGTLTVTDTIVSGGTGIVADNFQNNGGKATFDNCIVDAGMKNTHTAATLIIKSGTYSDDLSAFVSGCAVINENDNGTWTITHIADKHTEVTLDAVAPDCENTGLTEGVKCSACEKILVPQEVLAAGHDMDENGVCKKCGAAYVAMVEGAYYDSLAAAIAAANSDDTVTLLKNLTLTEMVDQSLSVTMYTNATATTTLSGFKSAFILDGKTLKLDLNGKTISSNENMRLFTLFNGANLTVSNGSITMAGFDGTSNGVTDGTGQTGGIFLLNNNTNCPDSVRNYLTLNNVVVTRTTAPTSAIYGALILVRGKNTATVNHSTLQWAEGLENTVCYGTFIYAANSGNQVYLNDSTLYAPNGTLSGALYTNASGNIVCTNCTIYGERALHLNKTSNLKITGGTYSFDPTPYAQGCSEIVKNGDVWNVTYIAKAHNIQSVSAKDPTCTEAGHEAYEYCTNGCGYTTYQEIAASGHNYEGTPKVCTICGEPEPIKIAECAHCHEEVVWTEIHGVELVTVDGSHKGLPGGHYYLASDYEVKTRIVINANETYGSDKVCIDLNGNTWKQAASTHAFWIRSESGDLAIMDLSAEKDGKVTGGYSGTGVTGPIVYMTNGEFSLYGGTLEYTGTGVKNGGIIGNADGLVTVNLAGGRLVGGKAINGGSVYLRSNGSKLNISGNVVIEAGTASDSGSGIYLLQSSVVNISGGTIHGTTVAAAALRSLEISNAPVIDHLDLTNGLNKITLGELTAGASITVAAENGSVISTESEYAANAAQYFHCVGDCLGVKAEDAQLVITEKHNVTKTDEVVGDCENTGNTAYWTCSDCGKYFADAEATTEIEENAWITPVYHDMNEYGTCQKCGVVYAALVGNVYYNDFIEAIEAGIANGETVKLLASVELGDSFQMDDSHTAFTLDGVALALDLNGRTISSDLDMRLFRLINTATLTLTSSATDAEGNVIKGKITMAGLQALDSVTGQGGGFIQLNNSVSSVLNAENIIFTKTRQDTSCSNNTESTNVKAVPGGILQVRGAGTATLTDCDFIWAEGIEGNVNGGGCISAANSSAKVIMTGCKLSGGRALNGGNLGLAGSCVVTVDDCVIENGVATSTNDLDGGNIYISAGSLTITDTIVTGGSGSVADNFQNNGGKATFDNCTVDAGMKNTHTAATLIIKSGTYGDDLSAFVAGCATCVENGNGTWTVTHIADTHALQTVDAKDPTCTDAGYEAYEYCTNGCGYTTYQKIEAVGHIWAGSPKVCTVCGEAAPIKIAECAHCNKEVVWTEIHDVELVEVDTSRYGLPGGHYYLDRDYNMTARIVVYANDAYGSDKICIDLNGHTIKQPSKDTQAFWVRSGSGDLAIMDLSAARNGKVTSACSGANTTSAVVYMTAGAFSLYSGTLESTGTGVKNGGIIGNGSGTVTVKLAGGRLVGGKAVNGGSVYMTSNASQLLISNDVVIEEGTVTGAGSGIYLNSASTVNISGGTIHGTVFYAAKAVDKLTISNAPVIDRLDLTNGTNIVLGELTEGASITVVAEKGVPFCAASEHAANAAKYFHTEEDAELYLNANNELVLRYPSMRWACPHCGGEIATFVEISSTDNFRKVQYTGLKTGHYYLADAFSYSSRLVIEKDAANGEELNDVVINLNGNTYTKNGSEMPFWVRNSGAKLSIMDTAEGGKMVSNTSSGFEGGIVRITAGGQFDLYGGTLEYTGSGVKNAGVVFVSSSVFNMYGGKLTGGKAIQVNPGENGLGGAIYISNGEANIYGGIVDAGTAFVNGVNTQNKVYITGRDAKLTMADSLKADFAGMIYAIANVNDDEMGGIGLGLANNSWIWYPSVETLAAAYQDGDNFIRLMPGGITDVAIDGVKDYYIDINGIDGAVVNVPSGSKIYWMDTANDDFDVMINNPAYIEGGSEPKKIADPDSCGYITADPGMAYSYAPNGKWYITVKNSDGTYSFHCLEMRLEAVNIRSSVGGVYYTAVWNADTVLTGQLDGTSNYDPLITGYGIALTKGNISINDFVTKGAFTYFDNMEGLTNRFLYNTRGLEINSCVLKNIVSVNNTAEANRVNAQTKINAAPFIYFEDYTGKITTLVGEEFSSSFADMIELAAYYATDDAAKAKLQTLYESWVVGEGAYKLGEEFCATTLPRLYALLAPASESQGS